MSLRILRIDSLKFLEERRQWWDHLNGICDFDYPFLEFEWVKLWWKYFGSHSKLLVLFALEGDEPVGCIPLMIRSDRYFGMPVIALHLLANYHSNRTDFLVPMAREDVLSAFYTYILKLSCWDICCFYPLPERSEVVQNAKRVAKELQLSQRQVLDLRSPFLEIKMDWDSYLKTLSKSLRYKIHRSYLKLKKEGMIPNLRVASILASGYNDDLTCLMEIASKTWAEKKGSSISSNGLLQGFYAELAYLLAEKGWLSLAFLELNGKAVAFEYNLMYKNRLYNLKVGYEERVAKYSPGFLLKTMVLKELHETKRASVYEFLGEAEPYKLAWTDQCKNHVKLFYFNNRMYPRLLQRMEKFVNVLNITRLRQQHG